MFKALCLAALPALGIQDASQLMPESVVALADQVRNPQIDYIGEAVVTSVKPGASNKKEEYEILVKGRDLAVVKTLSPANERGTSFLQDHKDVWSFLPTLSQPVRLSLQQRLIGDVANGDLTRTNFFGDYKARFMRPEREHYILELLAKNDAVTYDRVVYWVRKDNFYPFKAKFYAASGRLLKTCSYENYRLLAGRMRPSRIVLRDAVVRGQYSVVEYTDLTATDLPARYFTKAYLKKLKY